MKNKLLVLALSALAFAPQANAQKIDRNSLGTITLSGYPLCPISLNYTSYALVDERNMNVGKPVTEGFFVAPARLSRTHVTNGADITVRYSGITDFTAPIELVKEEDVFNFRVKRGHRPVRVKVLGGRYQAFGYKTFGFFVDVTTDKGVVYSDSLFSMKEYETPLFRNPKVAEAYLDSLYRIDENVESYSTFNMKNEASKFNRTVCENIGFLCLDSYRFHVYSVKPKGSEFNYKDLQTAAEVFEKAAKIISKNDADTVAYRKLADPCLKVWMDALSKTDDKRFTRDIVAAIFYNIGNYYVFLKEYDKASGFYSQAATAKNDFADTERLIKYTKAWAKAKARYENMMREAATGK